MIRLYTDGDFDAVAELDMIFALGLRWHGGYDREHCFLIDEDGVKAAAVLHLGKHCYIESGDEEYLVEMCCADGVGIAGRRELIKRLIARGRELAASRGRRGRIQLFENSRSHDLISACLAEGFIIPSAFPQLVRDLREPLPEYGLPEDVEVIDFGRGSSRFEEYMTANGIAFDGIPDSRDDVSFTFGAENFRAYLALVDGNIAASVSTYDMAGGAATETVFTLPQYQRRGIAAGLITKALTDLRERGIERAFLGTQGVNKPALTLYHKLGYRFNEAYIELSCSL